MDYFKNGVIFNIKLIKENSPETWDKYKRYFENITFEDEEKVYLNYLSKKIDDRVLFNFLTECLPKEMRLPLKDLS
ncbi:hypothetical protein [Cytobacillus praedii]|uniref:hypothetical protein n=1 Tax=Cytobacillus praedii TaxID=1742358 RepID=UPI002E1C03BA|nr:hypothetical protein [Cytobacillus praedii]